MKTKIIILDHDYMVSEEEIKEGDYCIVKNNTLGVYHYSISGIHELKDKDYKNIEFTPFSSKQINSFKKVIASDNKNLADQLFQL